MLIKIKRASDVRPSEITDQSLYHQRREFIRNAALLGIGAAIAPGILLPNTANALVLPSSEKNKLYSTDEEPTPKDAITSYNNFYELGTGKGDPQENAKSLKTDPWTITVDGECAKPGKLSIEDFIKPHALEERIYRMRCVEAWSMVIPWVGFELGQAIKRFEPTSKAKYVAFTTIYDPEHLPGQTRPVLDWPYVEGLRMDEAMNPLTLLAVGLYGEAMPNQNGAPIRLVVPWKYGFKGIKSIVKISFTEAQPPTSWNVSGPNEYGFYSNVNPDVDHPRWSQKRERRIGEFLKQDTLMFNGYGDEVAALYQGMDLEKNF